MPDSVVSSLTYTFKYVCSETITILDVCFLNRLYLFLCPGSAAGLRHNGQAFVRYVALLAGKNSTGALEFVLFINEFTRMLNTA